MRRVLRVLARVGLWLLALLGGFAGLVFVVVLLGAADSDQRVGAIVLIVASLLVVVGALWGLRHTRRLMPAKGDSSAALADARERLRAGQPIVLRPSRHKWAWMLVGCSVFTAVFALALAGEPSLVMGIGVLLCGAGVVLSVLQLRWGRAYLRIARDGLVARAPIRGGRWDWNEIEHFHSYDADQYGMTKLVGFDRRDVTPEREGLFTMVGRGMTGADAALPDTYGLRAEELANLLEEARERYASERGMSPSERADRELAARAARVRHDRVALVTTLACIACTVVYVLQARRYGLLPTAQELVDAGGAAGQTVEDGRWWTLLTANVLHANPVHLILNLLALAVLGSLLEREIGWPRFALLCAVSAVAAMGLAVLLQPHAVVVGVSGVIFGVAGWAVVRDPHRTRALGAAAWGMLPLGIVYTFLQPGVSIGAHVGGLLAGLAFGYAFERLLAGRHRPVLGA